MKIFGLIAGIGLTVLSSIALVISFMLPTLTSNHVNKKEAMLGIIPSVLFIVIGLIITGIFALVLLLGKKSSASSDPKGELK